MIKKILLTLVGLLLVVGVLAGLKIWQFQAMAAADANSQQPPATVTTAVVQQDFWQPTLNAVGSVIAVQGVTISAEVAATVKRIAFESGATVRAGELLVELDDAVEQAQLRSAIASSDLAQLNLKRVRDLRPRNMVSQSDVDSAEAQAKQANAQVDNIRAVIAKKSIRAPFAGRLGIRQINLGQFLDSGTAIVSLQTVDPIYVDFALPQQNFPQLRVGMTVHVATDAAPGQTFEGKLSVISPEVDALTRTVRLRAALANPDGRLQPGMYVNVAAVLPAQEQVLMIPATAVLYAPYGDSVFVVEEKPDEKTGAGSLALVQKFVQLGPSRGDFVVVNSGLTVGETVVSTGVFKLRNGMKAVVDNQLAPNFQLAPKPANS
ncbi:MAG: efflux RND transporter periplasmic adaptor subunit [Candidatus Competibacteraceae bacterium]|nr:efflux RND transporter periplasmic adaptor subunit [Candidatus Competibacteraceae bacterium]MCP5126179.1 efflux RND transporter periplasmic adaptor subunit [Gammaproteobacteria bacterium]HRX71191.1 efflux RND transporter periplasmic adaptor subunit [Candidatus Competibacteraceae bacterium]